MGRKRGPKVAAAGWEENQRAAEEEKIEEGMVTLRSQEGMDFVVPTREASLSIFIHTRLVLYGDKHIVPAHGDGDGDTKSKYTPILLRSVRGKTLAKVLEYCRKHDDPAWDAYFASLDYETICDLILAAHSLSNRGLLALTCHVVANMVKGKSVDEIFKLFNLGQDRPLTWEQNALNALHIVRCQDFTAYDPKRRDFICTRLAQDNIAFFDHDKESRIARGPPLDSITGSILDWGVQSSLNIISVKVTESDVGYPLSVFGTVLARDEVDYKCVYLFRREEEDAQIISSMDDMLMLTDPTRGLVLLDEVYFEIDLRIKRDEDKSVDFSKGVVSLLRGRLHAHKQTMTVNLCSRLSSVAVACEHVVHPVEATVEITILKGCCNLGGVSVWADGNSRERIILYSSDSCLAVGGPVPLARRVVSVPMDKKVVIRLTGLSVESDYVTGLAKEGGEGEDVVIALGPSNGGGCVCSMGWGEVKVQVAWTGILKKERERYKMDVVGGVRLLR